MILDHNMIAGADMMCDQFNLSLLNLAAAAVSPESTSVSISENLAVSCSANIKNNTIVRSGCHTEIGLRQSNEDQHITIDDLSKHLCEAYKWGLPSSFYAVFDGHGGSEASSYIKQHAMRLFFEDSDLPQSAPDSDNDNDLFLTFLKQIEESHYKAFSLADKALRDECTVSEYCGTTALTVLVMGRRVIVANVGDCRAVICRNGCGIQVTEDHRGLSCVEEKERCERLGGYFDVDGYLNGVIGVTRALGDWYIKKEKMLIGEPDVRQMVLSDNDEFMIIACDGIWDVMSNQEAVALVRCQLRQGNDPERCAKELVNMALRLHATDNLTAIVVCFGSRGLSSTAQPRFPNSRLFRKKPLNILI